MGLLSKLFGDNKDVEKAAKDLFNGIFSEAQKKAGEADAQPDRSFSSGWDAPQENSFSAPDSMAAGPSGESWGPVMPSEPNQFNFGGTWVQYFEDIFGREFAAYRCEKESLSGGARLVYTFFSAGNKALVVELMSRKSASKKLRERTLQAGIPYLRFYYDYEGWWNTRAYVVKRMNNAISRT